MMKMNVFILYKSAIFVHVNWVGLDKKKKKNIIVERTI